MSALTATVPMPPAQSVNTGKHSCPTSHLIRKYGMPSSKLTRDHSPVTSAFWKKRIVTEDVGPFRVTGHKQAVALLRGTLEAVRRRRPDIYEALGTAGMLCNRHVRGNPRVLSNHGLGLAIDFTIEGVLDRRGDDKVQQGLLDLYAIMKEFGWYWGVEFGIEDAMHFEVSAEVIYQWIDAGVF